MELNPRRSATPDADRLLDESPICGGQEHRRYVILWAVRSDADFQSSHSNDVGATVAIQILNPGCNAAVVSKERLRGTEHRPTRERATSIAQPDFTQRIGRNLPAIDRQLISPKDKIRSPVTIEIAYENP
jgi:hypothetical protein